MTDPVDSTVEPPVDPPGPGDTPGAGDTARTGDPGVDAALATIEASEGRPLADQVAAYQQVHQALQATLAQIDES